jgi:hypothetical protein
MLVEVVLVIHRGVCGFVGLRKENGSWFCRAEGTEVPIKVTSAGWKETQGGDCDEGNVRRKDL